MKTRIKIEVVSDVVCPWCYIGKRRLEKAIAALSDKYDFEVSYLPFELMPEMPAEGCNTRQHLVQKFGGEDRYNQIVNHVTEVAADDGLRFDLFNQAKSPNTRLLHRIIYFAQQEDKQLATVEAFFKAYFEDAVDLTNRQNVLQVSESAGLSRQMVEKIMDTNEGESELNGLFAQNKLMNISGVPFYIINDKYTVSGAQPTEMFIEALPNIVAQAPLTGAACDVEAGEC